MGKTIAKNKKASHDYHLFEKYECGIVLKGSEVKAIRAGRVNLKDSFVRIVKNELFLFNCHIGILNTTHHYYRHEERADRKLLLHRKEIDKLAKAVQKEGYTLVPTEMYFNHKNLVKIKIATAKGKKLYDKREDLKEKSMKKDMQRALKDNFR